VGHGTILRTDGQVGNVDNHGFSEDPFVDLTQRAWDLLSETEQIAEQLVAGVWEKLPGYETASLDKSELTEAMRASVRSVLTSVAERRRPTDEELTPARLMSERRAVQGVPIESLVGSWHNAERVLLDRLLATGAKLTATQVREAGRRLGIAIDAMIAGATSSYREIGNEIYAHVSQVGVDIVSRLAGSEPLDPVEVDRRARMVGVEAHLPHRALAISVSEPDGVQLARARRAVLENIRPHSHGRVLAGGHHGVSLMIFVDSPKALGAIGRAAEGRDMPAGAFVGVGETRPRLHEATASIHEAISAVRVGMLLEQRVTCYEQVIPEVLIAENPLNARRMVSAILGRIDQPEPIETLRVFLGNGLSTRATARHLGVHENTVAYRIRRVTELLGVENAAGLVRPDILLALRAREMLGDAG
jgi:hypothetical protein